MMAVGALTAKRESRHLRSPAGLCSQSGMWYLPVLIPFASISSRDSRTSSAGLGSLLCLGCNSTMRRCPNSASRRTAARKAGTLSRPLAASGNFRKRPNKAKVGLDCVANHSSISWVAEKNTQALVSVLPAIRAIRLTFIRMSTKLFSATWTTCPSSFSLRWISTT